MYLSKQDIIMILDEYLDNQNKYEKKYGDKTIVFMEVGMFYEIYGVNNNKEKLGKVSEISDILNIQMSRKNKSIIENSRNNPLMAGVPNHSAKKYISILLNPIIPNATNKVLNIMNFSSGNIKIDKINDDFQVKRISFSYRSS